MNQNGGKVVIVKKKKGGHHEDHGGAWKVAYADFVTAMMAFFLVMWLLGMNQDVKDLVQGYFSNPIGFQQAFSGGANPLSKGSSPADLNLRRAVLMTKAYQKARFEETAEELKETIAEEGAVKNLAAAVEIVVTDEGMRIELMETGEGETFFDNSSANLKPALTTVLGMVAEELGGLPNDVVVEGHTDALQFGNPGYSNWELSVDRANAARRVLVSSGLPQERLVEVRGYADRHLKNPEDAYDPRNRRISVLLPFKEEMRIEEFPITSDTKVGEFSLPTDFLPTPEFE
jgi:chemotaxis protein MotB